MILYNQLCLTDGDHFKLNALLMDIMGFDVLSDRDTSILCYLSYEYSTCKTTF